MASILIIEDDDLVRRTLARALAAEGHEVREAANGNAGLALYQKRASDLVITDLVMPEREGLETIRELERIAPGTRIVAISGGLRGSSLDILAIAKRFGATFVLPKPFELEVFLSTVQRALETPIAG